MTKQIKEIFEFGKDKHSINPEDSFRQEASQVRGKVILIHYYWGLS
jgi:hypothetical protein